MRRFAPNVSLALPLNFLIYVFGSKKNEIPIYRKTVRMIHMITFLYKICHRSINSGSITASVHLLKHFPREVQADLTLAFYAILHFNEQENIIMNQDALLQALKMSAAAVSSKLRKEVYSIRAYYADGGTPPPRESRIDTSQPKSIIIGVSLAVIVVMVIVVVVVCR